MDLCHKNPQEQVDNPMFLINDIAFAFTMKCGNKYVKITEREFEQYSPVW